MRHATRTAPVHSTRCTPVDAAAVRRAIAQNDSIDRRLTSLEDRLAELGERADRLTELVDVVVAEVRKRHLTA